MSHPSPRITMQKKARKLQRNDEVNFFGKLGRVLDVHTHADTTTVQVKTYTSSDPINSTILISKATIVIGKDVPVRFRRQPKTN